ncbi:restriction endonuclease subunit S domain-containing protein [Pseudomonas sp. S3_E10]
MSFPAYPVYKDSEVTWIGDVPTSWAVKPFKWLLSNNDGGVWGDDPSGEGDTLVLRSTDQTVDGNWKLIDPAPRKLSNKEKASALLVQGDLVVTKSSGSSLHIGKTTLVTAAIAKQGCCYGNFMQRLRVNSSFTPKLAWYVMNNELARAQLDLLSNSTTGLANLNGTLIGEILLPVSTVVEQTQIARFLDHETAHIDALIEEQQRLIELLKEKRQAVISHAVTKGLDPMVPMKDSGVEWLGDVPAHWVVCATRRAIRFIEQGWSPECESYPAEEDGWGVLKAGCVNGGFFDSSENKTLPSTLKPIPEYEVRAGDILMSRASGSPELVGSTALLGQVRERLMLSDKIFRVHLEEKVSTQFFVWVMNAQFMRSQIEQALSGGNGLANNLPQSSLLAFWLAIPPEHEQGAIAELINEKTGRIDELIAEGDLAVELLQERRSALISAAVTGKIDVRGWQPPTDAPSPELAKEAV